MHCHLIEGEIKGWDFVSKLYSDEPAVQGALGTNLVLKKDHLYVTDNRSAPDGTLKHVGAVVVYEKHKDKWKQETTILNPNPHQLDFFGAALAVDDDFVAVGTNANFSF